MDAAPDPSADVCPTPTAPPRRRRLWLRLTLGLLLIAAIAGGTVIVLLRTDPPHWREHQRFLSKSPQEIQQLAQSVEGRVLSSLMLKLETAEMELLGGRFQGTNQDMPSQAPAPIGREQSARDGAVTRLASGGALRGAKLVTPPTTLTLTVEEINAWITENFADWMTYKGYDLPREIQEPMFSLRDGGMLLAFRYDSPEWSQVFTATFDVQINDDGRARLQLRDVQAGNLPIPTHAIGKTVAQGAPGSDQAQQVANWLDKLNDFEFSPVIKLDQNRKVRVLAYELRSDSVELIVEMEAPLASRKPDRIANVPTNTQ
jgi:hypothetical protein